MLLLRKRLLLIILVVVLVFSLCLQQFNVPADSASNGQADTAVKTNAENILIAYFTATENSGVDAVASASYTTINGQAVGRLRAVADMIQENTGGDLFSIQTAEVYPANGGELIDYAAEEQNENARPKLTSHIEDLDRYDVIFIGYPNWWADLPMAVYSFLMSMIFRQNHYSI